jgi:hypothetical protein
MYGLKMHSESIGRPYLQGASMASFTDGLVSDNEAKTIYLARSKSVDEKTVSAANADALPFTRIFIQ